MNKKLLTSILKAHQIEGNNFYFVYDSYLDIMDSHAGAIILAKLIFWANGTGEGDSFSKTDQEIMLATRSNKYQVKEAKKKVQELGLFETETKGMPRKTFYTFDIEKFAEVLDDSTNSSMSKIDQLVCLKSTNKLVQNRPTININKEKNKINKEKIDNTEYSVTDTKTPDSNPNPADCKNLSTPSGLDTSSQANMQTSNLIAKNTESKPSEVNEGNQEVSTNQIDGTKKLRDYVAQLKANPFMIEKIAKEAVSKLRDQKIDADMLDRINMSLDKMLDWYERKNIKFNGHGMMAVKSWFVQANTLGHFDVAKNDTETTVYACSEEDRYILELDSLKAKLENIEANIAWISRLEPSDASEMLKNANEKSKKDCLAKIQVLEKKLENKSQAAQMFGDVLTDF